MTDISIEQTRFGHDGDAMIVERNYPDTAILRRYVYGPGMPALAEAGEPLVRYEGLGHSDRANVATDRSPQAWRV